MTDYRPLVSQSLLNTIESRALAAEARVSVLEKALRDLLGCFVFHTALDDSPSGMIDWWTIKAGTRYGSYEDCGIPMSTVQAVRTANAALDEPNRKRSRAMCDDWLTEYKALRDRPPAVNQLQIVPGIVGLDILMLDGDHIAAFYGSQGSDPPQDPRRNALLFVKAWEATHE